VFLEMCLLSLVKVFYVAFQIQESRMERSGKD
jgi:hypothetical protein